MNNCVIGRIKRVEALFGQTESKPYLDSFKFDCAIRNLTEQTIEGYYERLGYLLQYLQNKNCHPILKKLGENLVGGNDGQINV